MDYAISRFLISRLLCASRARSGLKPRLIASSQSNTCHDSYQTTRLNHPCTSILTGRSAFETPWLPPILHPAPSPVGSFSLHPGSFSISFPCHFSVYPEPKALHHTLPIAPKCIGLSCWQVEFQNSECGCCSVRRTSLDLVSIRTYLQAGKDTIFKELGLPMCALPAGSFPSASHMQMTSHVCKVATARRLVSGIAHGQTRWGLQRSS